MHCMKTWELKAFEKTFLSLHASTSALPSLYFECFSLTVSLEWETWSKRATRSITTYRMCMRESLHSIYIHAFNRYEQQLTLVMQLQCLFFFSSTVEPVWYIPDLVLKKSKTWIGWRVKVERRILWSSVATSWNSLGINPPLSSFYCSVFVDSTFWSFWRLRCCWIALCWEMFLIICHIILLRLG